MFQTVSQSRIFRVVQVIKSLQDPLEVRNNLPGINDNVRERGLFMGADHSVALAFAAEQ